MAYFDNKLNVKKQERKFLYIMTFDFPPKIIEKLSKLVNEILYYSNFHLKLYNLYQLGNMENFY